MSANVSGSIFLLFITPKFNTDFEPIIVFMFSTIALTESCSPDPKGNLVYPLKLWFVIKNEMHYKNIKEETNQIKA